MSIYLAGGGSQLTNSTQVNMWRIAASGNLNVTNATAWSINGTAAMANAMPSADYGDLFLITQGGAVSGFGPHVRIAGF